MTKHRKEISSIVLTQGSHPGDHFLSFPWEEQRVSSMLFHNLLLLPLGLKRCYLPLSLLWRQVQPCHNGFSGAELCLRNAAA